MDKRVCQQWTANQAQWALHMTTLSAISTEQLPPYTGNKLVTLWTLGLDPGTHLVSMQILNSFNKLPHDPPRLEVAQPIGMPLQVLQQQEKSQSGLQEIIPGANNQ